MKKFNYQRVLKITVLIWIFVLTLSGCESIGQATKYDDEIDIKVKNEVQTVIDVFFAGVNDMNIDTIQTISYVDDLVLSDKFISFIENLNKLGDQGDYKLLQEAYTISDTYTIDITLPEHYTIIYPTAQLNAFSVFYTIEKGDYEYIVTLNLVEDKDIWYLSRLDIGEYQFLGKNVDTWRQEAETYFENGNIIAANSAAYLALRLINPTESFKHADAVAIEERYKEVNNALGVAYDFPFELTLEDDSVRIYDFTTYRGESEIATQVRYITDQSVIGGDSDVLDSIAKEIHAHLLSTIPDYQLGISNKIVYTAYNVIPNNPDAIYDTYDTFINLN
ncbi:MAG: hypothetical protein PF505_05190 [Vallitaleaceae bacterium]|jgi:hypothetical protein|nr:hypothetical protein [Vallitaleaceae bacterium]